MPVMPALQAHSHQFGAANPMAEKNTLRATIITLVMMVVEITGGYWLNSMALLADGWHMSSHALALGMAVMAYVMARRLASDQRFTFGTWKIEILGSYSSALLLCAVALLMLVQSVERLFSPQPIHYNEAIGIAIIGLLVNLLCAWLLKDADHGHHHHHHGHDHGHGDHAHDHAQGHDHGHEHQDMNLRAAYVHVMADAATSVLAIVALLGGKFYGAQWLDPLMGIVGAVLVAVWAWGLLRQAGRVLLDAEMDAPVVQEVRDVIRDDFPEAQITDLHVWRVSKDDYACIVALNSPAPISADAVRKALGIHEELVHVTVEVQTPVQPPQTALAA